MSEVSCVQLRRQENNQPWGFRLRGGTDQGIPLHVEHVNPKGRSAAAGLSAGDVILSICGAPTQNMTHMQVKQEMLRAGNELDLVVAKGALAAHVTERPAVPEPAPAPAQQEANFTSTAQFQGSVSGQQGGALQGQVAPPQPQDQRVQVVEEPTCKMGGPTYKNVQTKTMAVLESELPEAEQGGSKPASIFSRRKDDRSGYLHAKGPTIQKAYGQQH